MIGMRGMRLKRLRSMRRLKLGLNAYRSSTEKDAGIRKKGSWLSCSTAEFKDDIHGTKA